MEKKKHSLIFYAWPLLCLLYLLPWQSLRAEPPVSGTLDIDRQTFQLAQNGQWDELIELSRKALKQDIDFYYLRLRLGLAWLNKNNYHLAITQFKAALAHNPGSIQAIELLYLANLNAGRQQEAWYQASRLDLPRQQSLGYHKGLRPASIHFIFGHQWQNQQQKDEFQLYEGDLLNGTQFVPLEWYQLGLGLSHRPGAKISLYQSVSLLRRGWFIHSITDGYTEIFENNTSTLYQYHGSAALRLPENMVLSGGFQLTRIQYPMVKWRQIGGNWIPFDSSASRGEYAVSLNLIRHFHYVSAGLGASAARINQARQQQYDLQWHIYPFGNLNFYSVSVFTYQREKYPDHSADINERHVFFQRLGIKLTPSLWLEAFAGWGEIQNFVQQNTHLIYNSMNPITSLKGAELIYLSPGNMKLLLSVSRVKESSHFTPGLTSPLKFNTHEFSGISIKGGLIWPL